MKTPILLFVTFIAAAAFADNLPYKLTVVRNGKAIEQVAAPGWRGEYPSPVIDVQSNLSRKSTQVTGFASLRNPQDRKVCTIRNGLYHPWSTTANSSEILYSIVGVHDFEAVEDVKGFGELGEVDVKAGDQIINTNYESEGWCSGVLNAEGKLSQVLYTCDALSFPKFKEIKTTEDLNEQWLYLNCAEGYKVFVQDSDLLSQPKIKEGHITGYGEIGGN